MFGTRKTGLPSSKKTRNCLIESQRNMEREDQDFLRALNVKYAPEFF
jgi:hypothetical protein